MSKTKTFRPWNPEQTLLLPPTPVEWLPENGRVPLRGVKPEARMP